MAKSHTPATLRDKKKERKNWQDYKNAEQNEKGRGMPDIKKALADTGCLKRYQHETKKISKAPGRHKIMSQIVKYC